VYVFGRIRLLVQNTLARLAVRTSSLRCGSATNVAQIVIGGTKRLSPEGALSMPAFGHAYSDDEIAAVANYVTARFGANGSSLTARDVAVLRAQVSN
jgi:mono/diheme cytochrome c family protein